MQPAEESPIYASLLYATHAVKGDCHLYQSFNSLDKVKALI